METEDLAQETGSFPQGVDDLFLGDRRLSLTGN